MNDAAPVLIAYDGSEPARRAVREAASLFGPRPALVVTVWEPAMEYHFPAVGTVGAGMTAPEVDLEATQKAVDVQRARAHHIATDGAQLARSGDMQAEALALSDGNVAKTIVELARERRAAAIVVGSRGLGGLRARLGGSTSNGVLKHSPCPVVVVHDD
jgi:nucleotide-binding universal stress UspA family protein